MGREISYLNFGSKVTPLQNDLSSLTSKTFQLCNSRRTRRHSMKFVKRKFSTTICQQFLSDWVINQWNSLNDENVKADSLNMFKSKPSKLRLTRIDLFMERCIQTHRNGLKWWTNVCFVRLPDTLVSNHFGTSILCPKCPDQFGISIEMSPDTMASVPKCLQPLRHWYRNVHSLEQAFFYGYAHVRSKTLAMNNKCWR